MSSLLQSAMEFGDPKTYNQEYNMPCKIGISFIKNMFYFQD